MSQPVDAAPRNIIQVLRPFIALFRRQWLMMLVGLLLTFTTLLTGIGLLSLSGWFLSASAVEAFDFSPSPEQQVVTASA
jgi:ATP-binding cassette subfamily C protein CydC